MALVKVTHPGVAQPHSLTDPLLWLFDNNPNLVAIVLQLHDSGARAVVEHVKKSCEGPNRGMSLYLREWEIQDGSPGTPTLTLTLTLTLILSLIVSYSM